MKIFLSALENQKKKPLPLAQYMLSNGVKFKWNLMSYWYIKKDVGELIRDNSEEIMIDSGAHSIMHGKKADFDAYTESYAKFIEAFDRDNVIGYFEMDIDNIVGFEKVLEYRRYLEGVTDKIIPVWHRRRGIKNFEEMCEQYSGKIVAITGYRNIEIAPEQYILFLKTARKYGCKLHCLGMTNKRILDKVPFDYVDSSSWVQNSIYGRIEGVSKKVPQHFTKTNMQDVRAENYKAWIKVQEKYHAKWKKVCGD